MRTDIGWIKVDSEKLPDDGGKYLICDNNGNVSIGKCIWYPPLNRKIWFADGNGDVKIVAWAELPKCEDENE